MSYLNTQLISHSRKVCTLYKRAIRNLDALYGKKMGTDWRIQCVLLRQRFDENKNLTDMSKAVKLLQDGEKELFEKLHPQQMYFPYSPGGVAYKREVHVPDWVMDTWHPLEKEQYPEYFKLREKRKQEYLEMWDKKYGKPKDDDHH